MNFCEMVLLHKLAIYLLTVFSGLTAVIVRTYYKKNKFPDFFINSKVLCPFVLCSIHLDKQQVSFEWRSLPCLN